MASHMSTRFNYRSWAKVILQVLVECAGDYLCEAFGSFHSMLIIGRPFRVVFVLLVDIVLYKV